MKSQNNIMNVLHKGLELRNSKAFRGAKNQDLFAVFYDEMLNSIMKFHTEHMEAYQEQGKRLDKVLSSCEDTIFRLTGGVEQSESSIIH